MTYPTTIIAPSGRKIALKWHRLRRFDGDLNFSPQALEQGLAAGASLEIDLVALADNSFAVLHDETLDRETTGSGPVGNITADQLTNLKLRQRDGSISDADVMCDADLTRFLGTHAQNGALLQLDMKQFCPPLSGPQLERLAHLFAPFAANVIVSTHCTKTPAILSRYAPQLPLGFDPTYPVYDAMKAGEIRSNADAKNLLSRLINALGDVQISMVYLHYPLILALADHGIDLPAACAELGAKVDAWTLDSTDDDAATSLRRLMEMNIAQITTNTARELAEMVVEPKI